MTRDDIEHFAEVNGFLDAGMSSYEREKWIEFGIRVAYAERQYWIISMSNAFMRCKHPDVCNPNPLEAGDTNGL